MVTHYRIADLPERERPVNRLREAGPLTVSNAELLACILQTGDALHQANALLTGLGGLDGLARAEQCMFTDVPGIGAALAARVQAAMELGRRVAAGTDSERVQIRAPQDVWRMVAPLIEHQEQEHFMVLFLDTRNRVVDHEVLYKGTLNSSLVRIGEVFRGAIRRHCAAIIVAHNHPSGDPAPSPEDVTLTRRLVEAGQLVEVDMLDHVVIGRGRFMSLRERGMGFEGV
jgi:DNA repair protein RadC